jgi:hypothetical protein
VLPHGQRPCVWISCRHHALTIYESERATLTIGRLSLSPKAGPDQIEAFEEAVAELIVTHLSSCTLDAADRDERTLSQISDIVDVTRERVRQIESKGKAAFKRSARRAGLK